MRPLRVVFLCVALTAAIDAQTDQDPDTLRLRLTAAAIAGADAAPGAPALDRALSSSHSGASNDFFVAGYYFVNELRDGSLGPLHVSVFDRRTSRWAHVPLPPDPAGAVTFIRIRGNTAALTLHSGFALVIDARSAQAIGQFRGFPRQLLSDESVVYLEPQRQFSPTFQDELAIFDVQSRQHQQVFPGPGESAHATQFRETIRQAWTRLPERRRKEIASSVFGLVDDFDRSIERIVESDGGRLTLDVTYQSERLRGEAPDPRLETRVTCERQSTRYVCTEELAQGNK
jgi:hypothetical protein